MLQLFAAVACVLFGASAPEVKPGEKVELTIFYSADICGYLEPCG
ncbi:MAG: hypothetical protein QHJ34_00500 [bacterium]|nr:hypothetical protein [candidate division KSB1 bacterium]MDH7558697.1 hypothetical protein [bacterium]